MSELIKAIAVTTEMLGTEWSEETARAVAEELSHYPIEGVKIALLECRRKLKGRLTLADILDRIPSGHPGVEEAWAMIAKAMTNEALTLVWTDEMREAYGVANGVAEEPVQARMAFKEKYTQLVSEARAKRMTPKWSVSKGTDKADQERAILEAVAQGRLTSSFAHRLLPYRDEGTADATINQIIGCDPIKRLR
jgi:hypothetical protein